MGLSVTEKISRAKIQIQNKNSFFAYLSLYLKFKEVPKGTMPQDTMGVDCNGNIHYVNEFIEEITKNGDTEVLEGVIAHEIGHLVFLTELRTENRDRQGWNCASDLAINTLLKNNGFKLPEGGMIPDHYDKFKVGKKEIIDVSKKTAEEIYDEFPKIDSKNCKYVIASGSSKGTELGKIIDNHLKGKDGKDLTKKEKEGLIRDWGNKVQEAAIISKMKGDLPKGLDLLMGKLHEEKVDWRTMLNNHITNQIPYDYTWAKSSKRSVATRCYMPNQLKEKIEIVVLLDLSGSIGESELSEFLSEVIGMAKAYQERITMRILSHDTECYDCGLVANGNIEQLKSMKLKGGGGTSHVSSFEFIDENIRDCKCLVSLTDNYSDLENIDFNKYRFEKIFVISEGGTIGGLDKKRCKVIKLGKDYKV